MDSQRPNVSKKQQITIYLDANELVKLTKIANQCDNSVAWVIRQIIKRNVDEFTPQV